MNTCQIGVSAHPMSIKERLKSPQLRQLHGKKWKENVNDAPTDSVPRDTNDELAFAAISHVGISESPLRIGIEESSFPSSQLSGQSWGVASNSTSSAIIFGTSRKSRSCSAGVWSSCLVSRYSNSVEAQKN